MAFPSRRASVGNGTAGRMWLGYRQQDSMCLEVGEITLGRAGQKRLLQRDEILDLTLKDGRDLNVVAEKGRQTQQGAWYEQSRRHVPVSRASRTVRQPTDQLLPVGTVL